MYGPECFFFVNNKPKIERIKERTTRQRNKKIYRLDIIQDVKKKKYPFYWIQLKGAQNTL